jgi:hypothetical protein
VRLHGKGESAKALCHTKPAQLLSKEDELWEMNYLGAWLSEAQGHRAIAASSLGFGNRVAFFYAVSGGFPLLSLALARVFLVCLFLMRIRSIILVTQFASLTLHRLRIIVTFN